MQPLKVSLFIILTRAATVGASASAPAEGGVGGGDFLFYKVLNITFPLKGGSGEIKKQYRQMSLLHHPDRSKTTLETRGEDVKTTLETSGEDVKTTLETSGEDDKTTLEARGKDDKSTLEMSGEDVKPHSKRVEKMWKLHSKRVEKM